VGIEYDYEEIIRRKAEDEKVAEAVIELMSEDEDFRELVEGHVDVLDIWRVDPDEDVELKSHSGSGSLFSLDASWRIWRGKVRVVDKKAKYWSAGAASTSKSYTTVLLEPDTIVTQHYKYNASPSNYVHYLRVYVGLD